MKKMLYLIITICFWIACPTVFADSSPTNTSLSDNDMRPFRLTSNDIQSAHVKWGPGREWRLTSNEINSLLQILHTVERKDLKPYYGPFPKGGPFSVTITTNLKEKFSFVEGVGDEGCILCPTGQVYLPTFDNFMKPFKVRRANEMDMRWAVQEIFN